MVLHLLIHEHCIALNLVRSPLTSVKDVYGFQYTNLAHIFVRCIPIQYTVVYDTI